MLPTDLEQIIWSYMTLNEVYERKDVLNINFPLYCKYTKIEKEYTINRASLNGHLEIVKYLHKIGKDCTTYAIDWASKNGHREIVKFLNSIGKKCTNDAIN